VTLASKEVERTELHKTIWRIANDLRGRYEYYRDKLLTFEESAA